MGDSKKLKHRAPLLEPTGIPVPHWGLTRMLQALADDAVRGPVHRALSTHPTGPGAFSSWTHADCPRPSAEVVEVFICSECVPGASGGKEVFAIYTPRDEDEPQALRRWRADAQGVDRAVTPHSGVIINEPSAMEGLAAPRIVLLGRDVSRLVMSAVAFEALTRLREQAMAKLTPEEREAIKDWA